MTEATFIPRSPFARVIKEMIQNAMGLDQNNALLPSGLASNIGHYCIKRDTLFAFQIVVEQLLTSLFEMLYSPWSIVLIISNLLAIYTKRITIKSEDMRLVRDL